MRILVSIQHQCSCINAGCRLHYSEPDKNQVYVIMADNFYVILHTRIRRVFKNKLEHPEEQNTEQIRTEQIRAIWSKMRRSNQAVPNISSIADHERSDQS